MGLNSQPQASLYTVIQLSSASFLFTVATKVDSHNPISAVIGLPKAF